MNLLKLVNVTLVRGFIIRASQKASDAFSKQVLENSRIFSLHSCRLFKWCGRSRVIVASFLKEYNWFTSFFNLLLLQDAFFFFVSSTMLNDASTLESNHSKSRWFIERLRRASMLSHDSMN